MSTSFFSPSSKSAKSETEILPQDKAQALKALTRITQSLIDITDREGQSLAVNDMLTFAILQNEKKILAERYQAMSRCFRERIEEFRGSDLHTLSRLERLQKELSDKAGMNNKVVRSIADKSRRKTENHLFSVQELAEKMASLHKIKNTEGSAHA